MPVILTLWTPYLAQVSIYQVRARLLKELITYGRTRLKLIYQDIIIQYQVQYFASSIFQFAMNEKLE